MKALIRLMAIMLAAIGMFFVVTTSQQAVKAAGASVSGTIKLEGTAPHQKPIDMSKEPSCAAVHKDKPVTTETVVAGADGGLANVVVYVSQGLSGARQVKRHPALRTGTRKGANIFLT